jgi:hypothetical protein
MSDEPMALLRHTLATVAYRGGKALRDAPADFASFRASETTRTPLEILSHVGDLFDWACELAEGRHVWREAPHATWEAQVSRFFETIGRFDARLASDVPLGHPPERLFQGPIADALTHVGQIAMLRRMAGAPMRGENYFKADIVVGRTGPGQETPRREFE